MNPDIFFLIFFVTILATRIFVYLKPIPAPTFKGFRTHHWMYGLLLLIVGYLFRNVLTSAIGLGLFTDELSYILIGGKTHADNYSKISVLGTLLFVFIVFIFRTSLISILQK